MATFLSSQRFKAMASVVTSLMLASGCRSASVNSNSGANGGPDPVGSPPFYRSYDRSGPPSYAPPPYDDSYDAPTPQNAPPGQLPTPGYSEPEVPPSPSAHKSKWNFLPSGLKLPSFKTPSPDVRQTGVRTYNFGSSAKTRKIQSPTASPTLGTRQNNNTQPATPFNGSATDDQSVADESALDTTDDPSQNDGNTSNSLVNPPLLLPPGV